MNMMRTAMLLAFMTALFVGVGYLIGGGEGVVFALFLAGGLNFLAYWNSDKVVLRMCNAREVDQWSSPTYYKIVSELARKASLPQPKIYVIDHEQPNAFATGRNPQNAAVAASTGLLKRLNPEEISGVMAHELAHIAHRDTLIMTLVATLAGAISMLGHFMLFIGRARNSSSHSHGFRMIGSVVAVILAPFAAMLIQMAVSRTREYAADRRGAEICGNPLWLASALSKIASARYTEHNEKAEYSPATAHIFIINPLNTEGADSLFSTHPATENRIIALQRQAEEMGVRVSQEGTQWGEKGKVKRKNSRLDDNSLHANSSRDVWGRRVVRRGTRRPAWLHYNKDPKNS